MRSKTRAISYLFRFMLIFDINRFWIISASDKTIKARVGWADDGAPDYDEDEEVQDIEWDIEDIDNIEDALEVSELLIEQQLMLNDKITIASEEILNRLRWNKDRYDSAIKTLLNINVDMLDDGKKTDCFFVHF